MRLIPTHLSPVTEAFHCPLGLLHGIFFITSLLECINVTFQHFSMTVRIVEVSPNCYSNHLSIVMPPSINRNLLRFIYEIYLA